MKKIKLKIFCFIILTLISIINLRGQITSYVKKANPISNKHNIYSLQNGKVSTPHIIEVGHGQAFVDWTNSWAWLFYANYLYRLKEKIALGGGAGLQFDWSGLYPLFSLNTIYGNKSEGFAVGMDIKFISSSIPDEFYERFWISAGIYYKNFFIKLMPTFLFGYEQEWYFETGYSFTIYN